MPAPERAEVIRRLGDWLLVRRREAGGRPIGEDVDIIESRILESLELVEFILFIESETGREILTEHLDPSQLRTLSAIHASFYEAPHA